MDINIKTSFLTGMLLLLTDEWSVIDIAATPRLGTPMVARNQNIYIFGGDDAFVTRFTDLLKIS